MVKLMFQWTLQVFKEVPQPLGTMGPSSESVIHVTRREERFMGCLVNCRLLKVLHEEDGDTQRQ
jgi:hypothetical protein